MSEESEKKKLTFEQSLEKLEKIVDRIEEGKVSLEDSIEQYAEGIKLIDQCRKTLDQAEKKIQVLTKDRNGHLDVQGELEEPQEEEE